MSDSCHSKSSTAYPSDCEIRENYRSLIREKAEKGKPALDRQVILEKASKIKILLLDVDGVLTDGTLLYSASGEESKAFHTQDGFGLRLLHEAGIETGLITARNSEAVNRRGIELKMRYLYQGASNKLLAFQEILRESGCRPFEISYMGDDWLDLVLLQRAGFSLAPANCVNAVREVVHYVTSLPGGRGAVREACELLLESKGLLAELQQKYANR